MKDEGLTSEQLVDLGQPPRTEGEWAEVVREFHAANAAYARAKRRAIGANVIGVIACWAGVVWSIPDLGPWTPWVVMLPTVVALCLLWLGAHEGLFLGLQKRTSFPMSDVELDHFELAEDTRYMEIKDRLAADRDAATYVSAALDQGRLLRTIEVIAIDARLTEAEKRIRLHTAVASTKLAANAAVARLTIGTASRVAAAAGE